MFKYLGISLPINITISNVKYKIMQAMHIRGLISLFSGSEQEPIIPEKVCQFAVERPVEAIQHHFGLIQHPVLLGRSFVGDVIRHKSWRGMWL